MKMKIQQIKIEFHVTPQIKRYVYVYLLITENGSYLIDSGVAGSVQIATFCGQQGHIPRTVRAILSGQF